MIPELVLALSAFAPSAAAAPSPTGSRPPEMELVQDDLIFLRKLGADGELPEVAARRAIDALDPLPFMVGDTLGMADLHAHVLSEEGFDHRIVVSSPPPCDGRWHGLRYDLTRLLSGMPEMLADPTVADLMRHCPRDDFPSWRSFSHEQYALGDLYAAHKDGLNLMVVSAVNNQFLCALASDYAPDMDDPLHIWWPEKPQFSQCTDDVNIHRQLRAAWTVEEREAAAPGLAPNGKEEPRPAHWIHVALTGGEANHAMAAGRMVWALGVEGSDYLGPAPYGGIAGDLLTAERRPGQTAGDVKTRLQNLGVTVVIATHEWNNAVGGSALQNTTLFEPGYALVRRWRREDEWGSVLLLEQLLSFKSHYDQGDYEGWPMPAVRSAWIDGNQNYPPGTEGRDFLANAEGLSEYGRALIGQLLAPDSGMILDMTHLSERSVQDVKAEASAIGCAEDTSAPCRVLVSHGVPRSVARAGQDVLEYPVGDDTYRWVLKQGGLISFLPGAFSFESAPGSVVENSCPGSSRSGAQAYQWLRQMSPFIALGSDMNGAAIEAVPRVGPYSCSVEVAPEQAQAMRVLQCLRRATQKGAGPGTDQIGAWKDDYAHRGLSSERYLPDYVMDMDEAAREDHRACLRGENTEECGESPADFTGGTWLTAQRFVDTWAGEGRAVREPEERKLSAYEWLQRPPILARTQLGVFQMCIREEQRGVRVDRGWGEGWGLGGIDPDLYSITEFRPVPNLSQQEVSKVASSAETSAVAPNTRANDKKGHDTPKDAGVNVTPENRDSSGQADASKRPELCLTCATWSEDQEITVRFEPWSGSYHSWYIAAVEQATSSTGLTESLRSRGIPVEVDDDGHIRSSALSPQELAVARQRPSDECSPKDVKPVVK